MWIRTVHAHTYVYIAPLHSFPHLHVSSPVDHGARTARNYFYRLFSHHIDIPSQLLVLFFALGGAVVILTLSWSSKDNGVVPFPCVRTYVCAVLTHWVVLFLSLSPYCSKDELEASIDRVALNLSECDAKLVTMEENRAAVSENVCACTVHMATVHWLPQ